MRGSITDNNRDQQAKTENPNANAAKAPGEIRLTHLKNIPRELKARDQWFCWKYSDPDQQTGRRQKIPLNPRTGRYGSATNPATFGTYTQACSYYEKNKSRDIAGIGFALIESDPFTVIDLDKCRDAMTGKVAGWAQEVIATASSYTETSPSGEGFHVFVLGRKPDWAGTNKRLENSAGIEVVDSGRYFTVTGQHCDGTPSAIESRQTELEAICARFWNSNRESEPAAKDAEEENGHRRSLEDAELIEKAMNAKNGERFHALYYATDGGNASAGDQSLCNLLSFWAGRDPVQMDRIFRGSRRYRDKWDERRCKNGDTYGQHTIKKAIKRGRKIYTGPEADAKLTGGGGGDSQNTDKQTGKASQNAPQPIRKLMEKKLAPVRSIIASVLYEGVTVLCGKPKLGKSWLAWQMAIGIAAGARLFGKFPATKGAVLYLDLETNENRLQARLQKLLGDAPAPDNLYYQLNWPRLNAGGAEKLNEWLDQHPETGTIFVDVFGNLRPPRGGRRFDLYEEDYSSVGALLEIAKRRHVAVVLVHHLSKRESDDPLDLVSGSTGLTAAVDNLFILRRERTRADATLYVDGRTIEEAQELALTWDPAAAHWNLAGDAAEMGATQLQQRIIATIRSAGRPLSPKEVADTLDMKSENVQQRLYQMSTSGLLRMADRGKYDVFTRV